MRYTPHFQIDLREAPLVGVPDLENEPAMVLETGMRKLAPTPILLPGQPHP